MSSKKKQLNRRNFLKGLSSGAAALSLLPPMEMLLQATLNKAYAQMTGIENENKYVHLMLSGGPPRWLWDLPLNPNGASDPMTFNTMAVTSFNEATKQGEYITSQIGNYHMPHLWNSDIPIVGGGSIKMHALLQNMLMLRGYNTTSDGHGTNMRRHIMPNISAPSLSGLVADASAAPIPATAYAFQIAFNSAKGLGVFTVGGNDPLADLLSPLQQPGGVSYGNGQIETLIDQSLKALEAQVDTRNIKRVNTYNDRLNAKTVFKRNFGNLTSEYNTLFNKYQALISAALSNPAYQVGAGVDQGNFLTRDNIPGIAKEWHHVQDLNMGGTVHEVISGFDLTTTITNNTYIRYMAETFAVAEFVLVQDISSSFTGFINNLRDLDFAGTLTRLSNDSHDSGVIPTLYFFSKYYQALSACLYELTLALKAKNIFNNTVIQISGDFNRNGRADGSGSDHAWDGSNTTFLTGKVDQHLIIGNTTAKNPGSAWEGSWGKAAPMNELGGREMQLNNMATSAALLLGQPSPTPNFESMIYLDNNGKVKTNMGTGNV